MQAPIALARKQEIEAVLGRLPARDERSRQRLLPVAGGLGDLHVDRGRGRHCRRPGFRRRYRALRRRLPEATSGNSRRSGDSAKRDRAAPPERGRAPDAARRSARSPSRSHPIELQRFGKLVGGVCFPPAAWSWSWPRRIRQGRSASGGAANSRRHIRSCSVVTPSFGSLLPSSVFQMANSTCRSWVLAKPSPSSMRPFRSAAPASDAALAVVDAIRDGIVAEGEALREVLEVGDLGRAFGFHVEHADIEAFRRREIAPHVAREIRRARASRSPPAPRSRRDRGSWSARSWRACGRDRGRAAGGRWSNRR